MTKEAYKNDHSKWEIRINSPYIKTDFLEVEQEFRRADYPDSEQRFTITIHDRDRPSSKGIIVLRQQIEDLRDGLDDLLEKTTTRKDT